MEQCGGGIARAVVEDRWNHFFATLKKELVHHERYKNCSEARASLFEYIEVFYNRVRKHSALGYLSPVQVLQVA
ncbi:MAG TPA: hypothetical protein DD473_03460 [Planctomycetaceae bacterium]|nr:hypothetical protein [Planctomycetaceae bacterium]